MVLRKTKTSRRSWLANLGKIALGTVLFSPASADPAKHPLTTGERGMVASIVDGDTLFMKSGLKLRLSAMQAPKLPLGRPDFAAWPLAQEAKDALEELCLHETIQLYYSGQRRDRYERALAQAYLISGEASTVVPSSDLDSGSGFSTDDKPGLWLQEAMILRGYGRVYTWPDTWQDSARLYKAERQARAQQRGIWNHPFYAIRSPDPHRLAQDIDSFQLVEGIIISAKLVRGTAYLNFGADYRTDFTIKINKPDMKRFSGLDIASLSGAKVRVRGWVEIENGPMIRLDHPERLEILD